MPRPPKSAARRYGNGCIINAVLADGRRLTVELFGQLLEEEMDAIRAEVGGERFDHGKFQLAMQLFDQIIRDDDFVDFLTLLAYPHI